MSASTLRTPTYDVTVYASSGEALRLVQDDRFSSLAAAWRRFHDVAGKLVNVHGASVLLSRLNEETSMGIRHSTTLAAKSTRETGRIAIHSAYYEEANRRRA